MAVLRVALVIVAPIGVGFVLTRRTGVGANELIRRGIVWPRHALDLPPAVDNDEWLSFDEAAQSLGLSTRRLRTAITAGSVVRASNYAGDVGVTRSSVEREREWRRNSTKSERARRWVAAVVVSPRRQDQRRT
jgi:hypothetical protein